MITEETGSAARPVVVGIDGSAAAWPAVEWAAAEAARHGVRLRIVHAGGTGAAAAGAAEAWPAPIRRWLATADDLVRLREPAVPSHVALLPGTANDVLLAESRSARLLVIGSRGLERPIEALPLSTVIATAMHAACPVVVVPTATPRPAATGPVVLGADGSAISEAAVEFAFDAAAARSATVIAVHAWSDVLAEPVRDPLGQGAAVGWDLTRREQARLLADQLAPWQDKYPGVPVEPVVAHESPASALFRYVGGAGLLVVGSRGRGDLGGMLLGSTSQAMLYHATCPIAVVRPRNRESGHSGQRVR